MKQRIGHTLGCCYHSGVTSPESSAFPGTLRTVFLDRDGVINEKMPEGSYVTRWEEFRVLPGVPDAIAQLNEKGLRVIVVSNQRGVALGRYTASDVEAMHGRFQESLKAHRAHVDAFYFCPHDKKECNCRKPLPGMFEEARRDFPDITADTSVVIGDSLSDMEFGARIGMLTIFIQGDPARQKPGAHKAADEADMACNSLGEAVRKLLDAS
jgi:D-glycero-D-manno-heptose 1,7-bisphosphate phosphatase